MSLLLKLYLAHLIADFILQFKGLFQLKLKSLIGHLFHALIHFGVSLALCFPYLGNPSLWLFIAAVSVIHYFQDILKYRHIENKKYFFLIFVADQIMHFLFLAAILLVPMPQKSVSFPNLPLVNLFYAEDLPALIAIAFMISTFSASYLFHAFRTSYTKDSRKDYYITTREILHGIIERTWVTGIFLLASNPLLLLTSPVIGILRLPFPWLANRTDFLASYGYAALVGLLFRMWIY